MTNTAKEVAQAAREATNAATAAYQAAHGMPEDTTETTLASVAAGTTAITFVDSAGYTAETTVEGALAELYEQTTRSFREDFWGKAIDATNGVIQSTATGTTGNDIPFAIVSGGLGGTAQAASGGATNEAHSIFGPLGLKASTMGPIWMEARLKVVGTTTATDGDFYVGFCDAQTPASNLPYVIGADGATSTGVPTVAAMIGYTSITQTSGPIFAGAGGDGSLFAITSVGGVDTVTAFNTPAVDKDSAYHIYRVELTAAGVATFYVDGTLKQTVSSVTASTALCPYLNVVSKNNHENTMTIDYIAFGAAIPNAV